MRAPVWGFALVWAVAVVCVHSLDESGCDVLPQIEPDGRQPLPAGQPWLDAARRFAAFAQRVPGCTQPEQARAAARLAAQLNNYSARAREFRCPEGRVRSIGRSRTIVHQLHRLLKRPGLDPELAAKARGYLANARRELVRAEAALRADGCAQEAEPAAAKWRCSSGSAEGGAVWVEPRPVEMRVAIQAAPPDQADPSCLAEWLELLANKVGEASRVLGWKAKQGNASQPVELSPREEVTEAFEKLEKIQASSKDLERTVKRSLGLETNAKDAAKRAAMKDRRGVELAEKQNARASAVDQHEEALEKIAMAKESAAKHAEVQARLAVQEKKTKARAIELKNLAKEAKGKRSAKELVFKQLNSEWNGTQIKGKEAAAVVKWSSTPTSAPTGTPTSTPSAAPSEAPSTINPTAAPSMFPTATPTAAPSVGPSHAPTLVPTSVPTKFPTVTPTGAPTQYPTSTPSQAPTIVPSAAPSAAPSGAPSIAPTSSPTTPGPTAEPGTPTSTPSAAPSEAPSTINPTAAPSMFPTNPTATPTAAPSVGPSHAPTLAPTSVPTKFPTVTPSGAPTQYPTSTPSQAPTIVPSAAPSAAPTGAPSIAPTGAPTNSPTTPGPTAVPTPQPTPGANRAMELFSKKRQKKARAKIRELKSKSKAAAQKGQQSYAQSLERAGKAAEARLEREERQREQARGLTAQEAANKAQGKMLKRKAAHEADSMKQSKLASEEAIRSLADAEKKEEETSAALASSIMAVSEVQAEQARKAKDEWNSEERCLELAGQVQTDDQQIGTLASSLDQLKLLVSQKEDKAALLEQMQIAAKATLKTREKAGAAEAADDLAALRIGIDGKEEAMEHQDTIVLTALRKLFHEEKQLAVSLEEKKAAVVRYKDELKLAEQQHDAVVEESIQMFRRSGVQLSVFNVSVAQAQRDVSAAQMGLSRATREETQTGGLLNAARDKINVQLRTKASDDHKAILLVKEYKHMTTIERENQTKVAPAEFAVADSILRAMNSTHQAIEASETLETVSEETVAHLRLKLQEAKGLKTFFEDKMQRTSSNLDRAKQQVDGAKQSVREAEVDLENAKAVMPPSGVSKNVLEASLQLNLDSVTESEEQHEAAIQTLARAEAHFVLAKEADRAVQKSIMQVVMAAENLESLLNNALSNKKGALSMASEVIKSLKERGDDFLDRVAATDKRCRRDINLVSTRIIHLQAAATRAELRASAARQANSNKATDITLLDQQVVHVRDEAARLVTRLAATYKECRHLSTQSRTGEIRVADRLWTTAFAALNSSINFAGSGYSTRLESLLTRDATGTMKETSSQLQGLSSKLVNAAQAAEAEYKASSDASMKLAEYKSKPSNLAGLLARRNERRAAAAVRSAHEALAAVIAREAESRGRDLAAGSMQSKHNFTGFSRLYPMLHGTRSREFGVCATETQIRDLSVIKLQAEADVEAAEENWYQAIKNTRQTAGKTSSVAQVRESIAALAIATLQEARAQAQMSQLMAERSLLAAQLRSRERRLDACEARLESTRHKQEFCKRDWGLRQDDASIGWLVNASRQVELMEKECTAARVSKRQMHDQVASVSQLVRQRQPEVKKMEADLRSQRATNEQMLAGLTDEGEVTANERADAMLIMAQIKTIAAKYRVMHLTAAEHEASASSYETNVTLSDLRLKEAKASAKASEIDSVSSNAVHMASMTVDLASELSDKQVAVLEARIKSLKAQIDSKFDPIYGPLRSKARRAKMIESKIEWLSAETKAYKKKLPLSESVVSERQSKFKAAFSEHASSVAVKATSATATPLHSTTLPVANVTPISSTVLGVTWGKGGPAGQYNTLFRKLGESSWQEGGTSRCSADKMTTICEDTNSMSLGPSTMIKNLWPGAVYEAMIRTAPAGSLSTSASHHASVEPGMAPFSPETNSTAAQPGLNEIDEQLLRHVDVPALQISSVGVQMPPLVWNCSTNSAFAAEIRLSGAFCSSVHVEARGIAKIGLSSVAWWVGSFSVDPATGHASAVFGPTQAASPSQCQRELGKEAASKLKRALNEYQQVDCPRLFSLSSTTKVRALVSEITTDLNYAETLHAIASSTRDEASAVADDLQESTWQKDAVASAGKAASLVMRATPKQSYEQWTENKTCGFPIVTMSQGCDGSTRMNTLAQLSGNKSLASTPMSNGCKVDFMKAAAKRFSNSLDTISGRACQSVGLPKTRLSDLATEVAHKVGAPVQVAICDAAADTVRQLTQGLNASRSDRMVELKEAQMMQTATSQMIQSLEALHQRQQQLRSHKWQVVKAHGTPAPWSEVNHWACSKDKAHKGVIKFRIENDCSGGIVMESQLNAPATQTCENEFQAVSARSFAKALRGLRTHMSACRITVLANIKMQAGLRGVTRALRQSGGTTNATRKAVSIIAKTSRMTETWAIRSSTDKTLQEAVNTAAQASATVRKKLYPPASGTISAASVWTCATDSSQVADISVLRQRNGVVWLRAEDRALLDASCRLDLGLAAADKFAASLDQLAVRLEFGEKVGNLQLSKGSNLFKALDNLHVAIHNTASANLDRLDQLKEELQLQESVVHKAKAVLADAETVQAAWEAKAAKVKRVLETQHQVVRNSSKAVTEQLDWKAMMLAERRTKFEDATQKRQQLQEHYRGLEDKFTAAQNQSAITASALQRTAQLVSDEPEQQEVATAVRKQGEAEGQEAVLSEQLADLVQRIKNTSRKISFLQSRKHTVQAQQVKSKAAEIQIKAGYLIGSNTPSTPGMDALGPELARINLEVDYEREEVEQLRLKQQVVTQQINNLVNRRVEEGRIESDLLQKERQAKYHSKLIKYTATGLKVDDLQAAFDVADEHLQDARRAEMVASLRVKQAKQNQADQDEQLEALRRDKDSLLGSQSVVKQALNREIDKLKGFHPSKPDDTNTIPLPNQLPPVKPGSIRLAWNVSQKDYTQHQIEWQRIDGSSLSTRTFQDKNISVTVVDEEISGLMPGELYEVRLRGKRTDGWAPWSEKLTWRADKAGWTCTSKPAIQAQMSVMLQSGHILGFESTPPIHGKRGLNRGVLIGDGKGVTAMYAPSAARVRAKLPGLTPKCALELEAEAARLYAQQVLAIAAKQSEALAAAPPTEVVNEVILSMNRAKAAIELFEKNQTDAAERQSLVSSAMADLQGRAGKHVDGAILSIKEAGAWLKNTSSIGKAETYPGPERVFELNASSWTCREDQTQQVAMKSLLATSDMKGSSPMVLHFAAIPSVSLSAQCSQQLFEDSSARFADLLQRYASFAKQASEALGDDEVVYQPDIYQGAAVEEPLYNFEVAVRTLDLRMEQRDINAWIMRKNRLHIQSGQMTPRAMAVKLKAAEQTVDQLQEWVSGLEAQVVHTHYRLRKANMTEQKARQALGKCTNASTWTCPSKPNLQGTLQSCIAPEAACDPRMSFEARPSSSLEKDLGCLRGFQAAAAQLMADRLERVSDSIAYCPQLSSVAPVPIQTLQTPAFAKQQHLWLAQLGITRATSRMQTVKGHDSTAPMKALSRASQKLQQGVREFAQQPGVTTWSCNVDKRISGLVRISSNCSTGLRMASTMWATNSTPQEARRSCQAEFVSHSMSVQASGLRQLVKDLSTCSSPLRATVQPVSDSSEAANNQQSVAVLADTTRLLEQRTKLVRSALQQAHTKLQDLDSKIASGRRALLEEMQRPPDEAKTMLKMQKKEDEIKHLRREAVEKWRQVSDPETVLQLHQAADKAAELKATRANEVTRSRTGWSKAENELSKAKAKRGSDPSEVTEQAETVQAREATERARGLVDLAHAEWELQGLKKRRARHQATLMRLKQDVEAQRRGLGPGSTASTPEGLVDGEAAAEMDEASAEAAEAVKLMELKAREASLGKQEEAERAVSGEVAKAKELREAAHKQQILVMRQQVERARVIAAKKAERDQKMRRKVQMMLASRKAVSKIKVEVGYGSEEMRLDHRAMGAFTKLTAAHQAARARGQKAKSTTEEAAQVTFKEDGLQAKLGTDATRFEAKVAEKLRDAALLRRETISSPVTSA